MALLVLAPPAVALASAPPPPAWEIGPIIRGKNYSQGMPLHPAPARPGWYFDFPVGSAAAGHVHYVTFRPPPLTGKTRIVARYRVAAPAGTRFIPQESPDLPATVSLFFQRRGDSWTARGRYEHYRWYAPPATVKRLAPGEFEINIRLDDPDWGSVFGQNARAQPEAFAAALADPDRIGLVFGTEGARGHGVFASRPARFQLLSFRIL